MRKQAVLFGATLLLVLWSGNLPSYAQQAQENPRLKLTQYQETKSNTRVLCGTYRVFENRECGEGRTIDLYVAVLPAVGPDPAPDPIFILAGGPGQGATSGLKGYAASWLRRDRDIVLVDQRGTGRSNPLKVSLAGSDSNLQGYLEPIFQEELFRAGLKKLEKIADLTQYTTPIAMDDLNEVRAALGYEKINLMGGSYGTRASLVYMRRHPETVRSVVLNGVAPLAFTNPLYHAIEAQKGLDRIFAECKADPEYRKAFPNLRGKFQSVISRLEKKPAEVRVTHPATGEEVTVLLSRAAFAEALRVMMYYLDTNRQVPLLILKAYQGDYRPFAEVWIQSNRRLRNILCFGMLMSVVGSEDIPRIDPEDIRRLTKGTFLGDQRVRTQMAVAALWPRGDVPPEYGEPVKSDLPVLLLSGTVDPVTSPAFGKEAARHLKNSLHLVVPGAHGVHGPVIDGIMKEFLDKGSVKGLDTSRIKEIRLPRFSLPEGK